MYYFDFSLRLGFNLHYSARSLLSLKMYAKISLDTKIEPDHNFSIICVKTMNEFNISLFYLIHSPIELSQSKKKKKRRNELFSVNIFFFDFDIICQ